MSTVILTPTHLVCDHTVIHKTYPHQSFTDCHHQKIFIPPHRKYALGTVGEFDPKHIDREETYTHLGLIFAVLAAHQRHDGFTDYLFVDHIKTQENDGISMIKTLQYYHDVFDVMGKTFLVAKQHRFLLTWNKDLKKTIGKAVGPYAGIGSGGMIGVGLLLGKIPLEKIWEPLHRLDPMTSQEHTSVALSSLKPFALKR